MNIVGSGFGYLPQPLPFAGPASSLAPAGSTYLRIRDCANDQSCSSPIWDTASSLAPACQVYIANWTDTSIWLEVNLPVDTQDYYQFNLRLPSTVSPLADVTPLAFFPSTTGQNQMGCAIMIGDYLSFTVGNPQGASTVTITTQVSAH